MESKESKAHNTTTKAFAKKKDSSQKDSVAEGLETHLNQEILEKISQLKTAQEDSTTESETESDESSDEKLLRLQADFDNFRKRTQKERLNLIKYGNEELITELLSVVDNFDRAIQSIHSEKNCDNIVKGIGMIKNQLMQILKGKGLEKMIVEGQSFDPHSHEAVTFEETKAIDKDEIILEELQAGYKLHEKIIRVPKVKVSKYKKK